MAVTAALAVACMGCPSGAQADSGADPSGAARAQLISLLDQVSHATATRYGTTDDTGATVDAIKIISAPWPVRLIGLSYLGVYHVNSGGTFSTRLASSSDLLHWTARATLATDASQPTIAALPNAGYLVAIEKYVRSRDSSHLEFLYYSTLLSLLTGKADRTFDAPNQLSSYREGTPSIAAISIGPPAGGLLGLFGGGPLSSSAINVGFHYDADPAVGLDRNATGVLTNFSSWTEQNNPQLNNAFPPTVQGSIGGRDYVNFEGYPFTVIEAQSTPGSFASFRVYLWDPTAQLMTPLAPKTAGGSLAFGNPKVSIVIDPTGRRTLVGSLFVFSEAAAPSEAGPLVYYNDF
jgi:hypothetical protein